MQIILSFLFALVATAAVFAQPTHSEMDERYYMKGEKSTIQISGSGNPTTAAEDIYGNFVFGGKAKFDGKDYTTDWVGKYNWQTRESKAVTANKTNTINDCIAIPDGRVVCAANPFLAFGSAEKMDVTGHNSTPKGGAGFERLVYNPETEKLVIFGINKTNDLGRPEVNRYVIDGDYTSSPYPKALLFGYNSFEDYHKNSFATINNEHFAMWAYEAKNNEYEQTAMIGLVGHKEGRGGADEIDVEKYINNFVSDFRPYTFYENKAYEKIYKVQWAISGIHPKEDGTFLITVSFIHWTSTSTGKPAYQKGILGVEYSLSSKPPIINNWVVFPWEATDKWTNHESHEIKPYHTAYLGENDIAVFDQQTGFLFAINSDLDAQKSNEGSSTWIEKSEALQDQLINNRVIAKIDPAGYSLGFAHPNTTPENGKRKAITLVQNVDGSEFKIIKFNP